MEALSLACRHLTYPASLSVSPSFSVALSASVSGDVGVAGHAEVLVAMP